ncbi:hypothetical protein [Brevibacillus porteri]|uniref:hypothetical protein n=1 Tax=Brevibacillus porteri TaxID=2126350 RepID=UPI003630CF50
MKVCIREKDLWKRKDSNEFIYKVYLSFHKVDKNRVVKIAAIDIDEANVIIRSLEEWNETTSDYYTDEKANAKGLIEEGFLPKSSFLYRE